MSVVITLVAVLQILGGILIFAAAPTSIHQILGAVAFGFGTVCLALSIVADKLERQLEIFGRLGKPKG